MEDSLRFILGILEHTDPAFVAWEDFAGVHAKSLLTWQRLGFLASRPEHNPHPSCPYCAEGVPSPVGEHLLCPVCLSTVALPYLQVWRFDLHAFLTWLTQGLKLNGVYEQLDDHLWQLGHLRHADSFTECFFLRGGIPGEPSQKRLLAYRDALLLVPLPGADSQVPGFRGPSFSLLELLSEEGHTLQLADVSRLLLGGGVVCFEEASGALRIHDHLLGELPLGTREFHLLASLAAQQDRLVPYADLKHAVLQKTGGTDSTDEASFCQKLKGRIKQRWIPEIDRVIATTNKSEGYRLRARV